jgi:hypothetical protein
MTKQQASLNRPFWLTPQFSEIEMNFDEARKVIDELMTVYPTLTKGGWDQLTGLHYERSRDNMKNSFFVNEFLHAMAYISQAGKQKTVNHDISSYSFKHAAEKWGAGSGYPDYEGAKPTYLPCRGYVSNGAFICAAIASGLKIERSRDLTCPNCYVNLLSPPAEVCS